MYQTILVYYQEVVDNPEIKQQIIENITKSKEEEKYLLTESKLLEVF